MNKEKILSLIKENMAQNDRCDLFHKGECSICSKKEGHNQALNTIVNIINKEDKAYTKKELFDGTLDELDKLTIL